MKAGGVGGGEQRPSERHGTDVGEVRTSLRGRLRETQTGDPRAAPPCAHRRRVPMDGPRRGGPAHPLACALLAPHSAPQEGSAPAHPMSRNTHRELLLGVRCGPATTNPPPPLLSSIRSIRSGVVRAGGSGAGGQGRARQWGGGAADPQRGTGSAPVGNVGPRCREQRGSAPHPKAGHGVGDTKGLGSASRPEPRPDGGPTARGSPPSRAWGCAPVQS